MEIISYTGAAYAPQSRINFNLFKGFFTKRENEYKGERLVRQNRSSVRTAALSAKGSALYAVHALKAGLKYLWILPAVAFFALIPFAVTGVMDKIESRANTVKFQESDTVQREYISSLMSDFALEQPVGFDSDGNLLGVEGEVGFQNVSFKEPVTLQTYTVRKGDTISGITQKFGLTNISTLIAVNNIDNVRSLRAGQKLTIPSVDGLYHTVAAGESIASIAEKYSVSIADLLDVNDLSSETINAGSKLYIPGARMDSLALKKAMGEVFAWPITASFRISSKFGHRKDPFTGVDSTHKGIDLACPAGTSIKASLSGTVSYAGWSNIYGYYVIINHYDGYQTLYGHMSKILVKKGQSVNQGTQIGLVGSTGYSTGPHLHFTVYKNGKLVDPLTILK